jgi:PAS domain S-box-containing protein
MTKTEQSSGSEAVYQPAPVATPLAPGTPYAASEHERFLLRLAEAIPSALYIYEPQTGKLGYVNNRLAELLGYTAAEAAERGAELLPVLVPPDQLAPGPVDRARLAALADGETVEREFCMRHNNGEARWFVGRETVFARAADGSPTEVLGSAFDITGRKHDEARYRSLVEASAQVVWRASADGVLFDRRARWSAVTGIPEPELPPEPLDLVHPDDRSRGTALWWQAMQNGLPLSFEQRVRDAHGNYRVWQVRSAPVRAADGQIQEWIGTDTDVTEQKRAEARVAASEQQLRLITDGMPALISYVDNQCRYRFVNKTYTEWFGLQREEVVGRFMWEVLGEAAYEAAKPSIDQALEGAGVTYERVLPYKHGGSRFVQATYIPDRSPQGAVNGFFVLVVDLTERLQNEERLRHQTRLLEALTESVLDGILIVAPGAPIRYNKLLLDLWGIPPALAPGMSGERALEWAAAQTTDPAAFLARVQAGSEHRAGQSREEVVLRDGRLFECFSTAIRDDEHHLAWLWTFRDITERKRAEAAVRAEQAHRLAEQQRHAEQLQRLNAAALAINAAAARDEVLRLTLDAARALVGAHQAGISAERRSGWLAVAMLGKDGRSHGLLQVARNDGGEFSGDDGALLVQLAQIAAIALDNHMLYEQEQQLRATAEEASRVKDEFLATVSHELRTPLTSFLGYAQMLQLRKRDEAFIARTVERMVRSAKAQAQLIEDLLDISRIVSGKLRLDIQPVSLAGVIYSALDTVRPAADAKEITIRLEFEPELEPISGDANRLQQVVWNLLSNAAKFTPPGGTITVRLVAEETTMLVAVSDTGQGIAPDFLPYVFDRFRQADGTTNRTHGGLGLGLAIVRHLVELHGGSVHAASAGEGQGATFSVRLPRVFTSVGDSKQVHAATSPAAECPPQLHGLRVLVVDDQPDILELLEDMLVACNAVVRVCSTARQALALVREWQPAVLVSDIAMPGEDGYWLIEQLRALPPEHGGAVPAIALTAYVRMEDRLRVLAAGFDQYLPKPVEPGELRDLVARLVDGERE